jgi:hypothetical protein
MFGVTHPIIQYRAKGFVKITDYTPVQWSGKDRLKAYPRKPLLVSVSTTSDETPTPAVIFGGIEGVMAYVEENFGEIIRNDQGRPMTVSDWIALQNSQMN